MQPQRGRGFWGIPKYHTFKLIVGPFECTRSLRYINNISHYVEGLDGDGRWVMEIELLL